jgi:hypothetical protein
MYCYHQFWLTKRRVSQTSSAQCAASVRVAFATPGEPGVVTACTIVYVRWRWVYVSQSARSCGSF